MNDSGGPRLKRERFHVWIVPPGTDVDGMDDDQLGDAATHHVVAVTSGDQLRAELEAGRQRVELKGNPFHATALWLWAAAVRMGVYERKFGDFRTECVSWEPVERDPDRNGEPVDPTGASTASG